MLIYSFQEFWNSLHIIFTVLTPWQAISNSVHKRGNKLNSSRDIDIKIAQLAVCLLRDLRSKPVGSNSSVTYYFVLNH